MILSYSMEGIQKVKIVKTIGLVLHQMSPLFISKIWPIFLYILDFEYTHFFIGNSIFNLRLEEMLMKFWKTNLNVA